MARFVNSAEQVVQPLQPVLLDGSWWANRKYLFHQDNDGIVTLRGIVNNPYAEYAVYYVSYNANVAVPTGGTVGPVALALSRNGQPILSSKSISTPTAVDQYNHVGNDEYIIVPRGCCVDIAIVNASDPPAAGGAAPAVSVQNANLNIVRVA